MNTDSAPEQWTRDDLQGKNPEAISKARQEGRLNDLARGQHLAASEPGEIPEGQLSRADLATMSPSDVVKANRAGRLDWLKGQQTYGD